MPTDQRAALREIRTFPSLIKYLRDQMGWPIETESFEDLTFDYTPEELGIEAKSAAKIQEIKRLRPLVPPQPWGIFFVKFEPKRLPVVALRRILSQVVLKKRASANRAERQAWAADDLLFVSNYGEGDDRRITFAHFSQDEAKGDLPTLKVLGWDNLDTPLHLDAIAEKLSTYLTWATDGSNTVAWRTRWNAAFTLRHREVITTSRQLSIRLAELARAIRDRIKTGLAIETERGPLTQLMKAFQEALVHDLDAEGFADMYAQTIAYGLLSARIADPKANTADHLPAQIPVTNPFLKELMETFLQVGGRRGRAGGRGIDFDELGVSEVVELLDDAKMEEVVRDFGDKNPQEDPVIHFYELFLKEYDARKRMQRGVFYTPRPVVSYIVRSVDELLRREFGLEDGVADTTTWGEMAKRHSGLTIPEGTSPDQAFVQILDPACGTGTFLVEVIDTIHRTMKEKWEKEAGGPLLANVAERWNEYVPKCLLPRLHGYELLMAPYAIAHLKVGLKLYETGYRFCSNERARIYLTNSLEPPSDIGQLTLEGFLPALAHEAQAVNSVKRYHRFTILIGNPPYSISSANRGAWIEDLVSDYKQGLNETNLNALSDDYLKFIALTQYLSRASGGALVGLITNNSFLDGVTHRRLRERLLASASARIVNLHGSVMQRHELPSSSSDENVFDIQQGVAISILSPTRNPAKPNVNYVDLVGTRVRKYGLLAGGHLPGWTALQPRPPHFFFKPRELHAEGEYLSGFPLNNVFRVYSSGIKFRKDNLLVKKHFTRASVEEMLRDVAELSDADLLAKYEFDETDDWLLDEKRHLFAGWTPEDIVPVMYRALDFRYAFYPLDRANQIIVRGDSRVELMKHVLLHRNIGLQFNRQIVGDTVSHFLASRVPTSQGTFYLGNRGQDYFAPLYLFGMAEGGQTLSPSERPRPNFSAEFLAAMAAALGVELDDEGLPGGLEPEEIFNYGYAVFHSPTYRARYVEFLKADFPRLALPGSRDLFADLSRFGGELVALHLFESPKLNEFVTNYAGPKDPEVVRVGRSNSAVWLDAPATKKGQIASPGTIGFRGVPEGVWNFQVGGYQVCEKWLKDRKGRTLSKDDIVHYQKIVVALNETIRIMKEIDEVIEKHGGWPAAFQGGGKKAAPFKLTAPPAQGHLFDHQPSEPAPFRPRVVDPQPGERYVTCVPLVPLKAAAGAFGDPQHVEDDKFQWIEIDTARRLRPGMFTAQVVGKSMEPQIADGAYCLFAAPVEGTRQGKTVLVQLRDATDPETGERYTVKRYESTRTSEGDSWRHEAITLKPTNPDFEPIVLTGDDEGQLQVIAEFLEVLPPPVSASPTVANAEPASTSREIAHDDGVGTGAADEEPAAENGPEEPRERIDAAQVDRDELICRIRRLFGDGSSRDREQAIADLARGLGYERVGSKVREIVDNSLRTAVRRGVLASDGGGLTLDVRRIEDYRRDFLKEQFLASLEGRAWKQREDAIRDLARWLGFRRTGRVIDQTLRSIINGLLREGRLDSSGALIRSSG